MGKNDINLRNECWYCIYKREVPGYAHIRCANPDSSMVGSEYGIRNGWFIYPDLFDPVWKEANCANFEEK